jgi:hypothetical protein
MNYDKKQPPHPSYFHGGDNNPISSDRYSYQNQRFPSQVGDLNGVFLYLCLRIRRIYTV